MTLLPVDGSLVKENIVIRSRRDVMNIQWWSGRSGVLAIGCPGDGGLTIWELQPYLDQLRPSRSKGAKKNQLPVKPQQQPMSLLYTSANYTVHNFYCSEPIFPMASTKFYLLFGGDRTGQLNMLPVSDDKFESLHITHTAPITGVAAVSYFSILKNLLVFQWFNGISVIHIRTHVLYYRPILVYSHLHVITP